MHLWQIKKNSKLSSEQKTRIKFRRSYLEDLRERFICSNKKNPPKFHQKRLDFKIEKLLKVYLLQQQRPLESNFKKYSGHRCKRVSETCINLKKTGV